MCVLSSLCQLWQDLHQRNWKEIWSQITERQNWNGIQNKTHIHKKRSCIKFSHRPRNSREPCHQLISIDGDRQRVRAFYQIDQNRPYTSELKDNRSWTVMRAATNWDTHMAAFLTRRLPVVSRTGSTEYQLLPMKASDRSRNVKFYVIILVVFDECN